MKIPFFTPFSRHQRPIRCSCPIPATTNRPDGANDSEFTNPFYTTRHARSYDRNRPHRLQQLPVFLPILHIRIPQPNAVIVAPAAQQIRPVQRRAAHDPPPRRFLAADWTHRFDSVRVLP